MKNLEQHFNTNANKSSTPWGYQYVRTPPSNRHPPGDKSEVIRHLQQVNSCVSVTPRLDSTKPRRPTRTPLQAAAPPDLLTPPFQTPPQRTSQPAACGKIDNCL